MAIKQLMVVTGMFGLLSAPSSVEAADNSNKPNMIFFLGDDHSVFDTGCYGNKVVRTPNIDKLAQEGVRFDRAFTSTAMCAPSRSMLYTGLYPHRNGCHMNHGTTKKWVKSLPAYLKPLGYRVVLAGKTHIKPKKVYPFEYIKQSQVGKVINGKSPFCLIIASNEPHGPHKHGGYKLEEIPIPGYMVDTRSTRCRREGYYTDINSVDKELADVMLQLKKAGKKDNTLIVYAGDHGSGPMAKWTCYEQGLHVPFVVRWPGHIKPGTSTNAMISFVDVLPTFIEVAGGTPPKDIDGLSFLKVLEGKATKHRDFIYGAHTNSGIILGKPFPIRSVRGERFKYIRNLMPDAVPTNMSTHGKNFVELNKGWRKEWQDRAKTDPQAAKLVKRVLNRPAEELYDLKNDPWEINNLAENAKFATIKKSLSNKLDSWMKQQNDQGIKDELAVPIREARKINKRAKKDKKK